MESVAAKAATAATVPTPLTLKLLEQLDEWIAALGSRSKVVVRFYL